MLSQVVLSFGQSRAANGEDVAALIRESWPDADLRADLDERGALGGYRLLLRFSEPERAAEAAFRLAKFLRAEGYPFEVDVDHYFGAERAKGGCP